MLAFLRDLIESIRKPNIKEVYFRSLKSNRRILFWYAQKLVESQSTIEPLERLREIDELRKKGESFTFISNHLTYADSHIIESLFIRFGFKDLARHIIHIAGQKTFALSRRLFTRSLNTIRVYQPKAAVEKNVRRKMNARALKWAAHLKRRGFSVLVFPEGTRTRRHNRFNPAAANPKTTIYFRHSKVVPLALMGAEKIMPVGKTFQKPAIVQLKIGEPIDHDAFEQSLTKKHPGISDQELAQRMMAEYMQRISDLLDPDYQPAKY